MSFYGGFLTDAELNPESDRTIAAAAEFGVDALDSAWENSLRGHHQNMLAVGVG